MNDLRFPWYRVIWNVLTAPIIYIGFAISWVGIALNGLSIERANAYWRDVAK